jgi:hypothetical protein
MGVTDESTVLQTVPSLKGSFSDLIASGSVYIDKTEFIRLLLTDTANSIFLARPRRFGKTLLVSTIEAVIQGRTDLLNGYEICNPGSRFEFKRSHVIHLDMTKCGNMHVDFEKKLFNYLCEIANDYDISLQSDSSDDAISELIKMLYNSYNEIPLVSNNQKLKINGETIFADFPQVSVLIDEYDCPLMNHFGDPTKLKYVQEILGSFYAALKRENQNNKLRFVFVTGITRFKELLWQSGMNAIEDITFSPQYSEICGFTVDEIKSKLNHHIDHVFQAIKGKPMMEHIESIEDMYKCIEEWYDGYSWDGESRVLNPFSVFQLLRKKSFGKHWYVIDTPAILNKLNINDPDYFELYAKNLTCEEILNDQIAGTMSASTALLMTGYLTIKRFVLNNGPNGENQYFLGIPNKEIMTEFAREHLIDSKFQHDSMSLTNEIIYRYRDFTRFLSDLETDKAGNTLSSLLAIIPSQYLKSEESFFQKEINTAFMFFKGKTVPERSVAGGEPDFVLYHVNGDVYVVEIKYNKTATHVGHPKRETESYEAYDAERADGTNGKATADAGGGSPPGTPAISGRSKLARGDKTSRVEREKIRNLLDKGIKDAFDQLFGQSYAAGFLSPRYKVYAIAISIVNRSEVLVDCREVTDADWRNDPRPSPLADR